MPVLDTSLASVHYRDEGRGTPLILLHANPGDHRDFDAIRPALAARHRVLALDWPGYGDSPAPAEPQAWSTMHCAQVLREFVERLDLPAAVLIGNSVGGYAAARLALDAPTRVRSLVLVSPGGFTPHTAFTRAFCRFKGTESVTRLSNAALARYYLRRRTPLVHAILARAATTQRSAEAVAVNAAIWRSFTAPEHDLRARAAAIKVPVLLAFGRHDPVIPATRDGRAAARSLPAAEFALFDTGHMPFAEDPETFMKTVLPFLDRHGGSA